MIGLSLSLILVMRHQGSRGCPSAESGTHEECLTTQPAGIEKTGLRAQKRVSGVALAGATVSRGTYSAETSTLYRCVVQLQAVTSNRNEVSRRYLSMTLTVCFSDGYPAPVVHSSVRLTTEAS